MTARVVLIAYYFPPLVGIASERSASRAESLRALGWEISVTTVRDGHYHRVSEHEEVSYPVARTATVELSRIVRRAYQLARRQGRGEPQCVGEGWAVRAVEAGRVGGALRQLVREWVYLPDAQVGWIPFAAWAAARSAARGGQPVILSSSVPYSAHLAAWIAARISGAKWIAEFRDPWSTADERKLPRSRIRRRLDRALERAIVTRADHVVVTSETTRLGFLNAHRALAPEDISVVMNGFVPSGDRTPPGPGEPCRFVYAGTVDPEERPQVVMDALAQVQERQPGAFRLRVVGPSDAWCERNAPAPSWIEFAGVVTPAEARCEVLEASAVLLLQGAEEYRQILRGKAFEYVGARRPIVAIVAPDSEMARLLQAHADVRIVPSYDVQQLAAALEGVIEEHRAGALAGPRVSEATTAPLSRAAQAMVLDRILRTVVGISAQ